MTKTTFAPSEVAHAWAHQVAPKGGARPSGGGLHSQGGHISAYFEGAVLFSYGSHFVSGFIARPMGADKGGLAFVTSEKSSNTTNARVHEAWHAVNHFDARFRLPELTQLRGVFQNESVRVPGGYGRDAEHYKAAVLQYVRANAAEFGDSEGDQWNPRAMIAGAVALGAVYGVRKSSIEKAIRDGLADDAKAKAAELARELQTDIRDAGVYATASESDWRACWPRDPSYSAVRDHSATRQQLDFAKDVRRLAKVAKANLPADQADALKARAAEVTAWFKQTETRVAERAKADALAEFAAWEAGTGKRPGRRGDGFYTDEQNARIQTDIRREYRESWDAQFAKWKAGEVARPSAEMYDADSAERAAIIADEKAERDALSASYVAWSQDRTSPRPTARLFLSGELAKAHPRAWDELSTAEREAAEAEKAAKRAQAFADWRSGASNYLPSEYADRSGAAFVRRSRDGSELQTSQGATIPWAQAVRAFRFIKLCRLNAKGFRANGRKVPVGMYQVDSITAEGDMIAGCHRFKWAEIERLAMAEGVFELTPSEEAVTESEHA